ncbi:MAG: hypothetical protein Q9214_003955, partial [Letrouitia sp. 1 TL-2023]
FTKEDMLPTYDRMATDIEDGPLLCISVVTMVNILVKLFHLDSHCDQVYLRLGWHNEEEFGSEGKKVDVKYHKSNSNQPVKSYKVTIEGLIPVVDEEVANNVDVNNIASEASNDLGLDKSMASRMRTEFANFADTRG